MSLSARIKAQSIQNHPNHKPEQEPQIENQPDPVASNEPVIDPEKDLSPEEIQARTKESYEDEIKKLREENAKRRKKEQEAKEKALAAADEIFKAEREEYESNLAKMKEELKALKELQKQAKKVDDEVKTAESNAEIEALRQEMESLKAERAEAKALIEAQRQKEEEEKALRRQAAENRMKALLSEIPEDYQDEAQALFKGYEDPSEGLLALTRARAKGLFSKKTIEVVSNIPRNDKPIENKPGNKNAKLREALKNRRTGLTPGSRLT